MLRPPRTIGRGAIATSLLAATFATTPASAAKVPESFAGVARSDSAIELSWIDRSDGETGFEIQRRPGGAGGDAWIGVALLPPNQSSHLDSPLPEDSSFDYRIRTRRGSRSSRWATTTATTLPSGPSGLRAEWIDDGQIRLRWLEGSATAEHRIERRSDRLSDGWTVVAEVPAGTGASGWRDPELRIDAHDPTEFEYRVSAISEAGASGAARRWAPSCPDAPVDPEQIWLDDLRTRVDPDPWSGDTATLPPTSEAVAVRGWNRDGTACAAAADGHLPCDFAMIGNDRYLALFTAGGLSRVGAGDAQASAGALIGLTHREYGMELIRWDGIASLHVWNLGINAASDLTDAAKTFYPSGYQQRDLHSVKLESIADEPTLVFEWQLSGPSQGQVVKTFWTLRSRDLTGLHARIEVTGVRADGRGISDVQFPVVSSLGHYGADGVDLAIPREGLGLLLRGFSRAIGGEYLGSGWSAQFLSIGKAPHVLYVAVEDGLSPTDPDLHAKEFRFQNTSVTSGLALYHYPADGAGAAGNSLTHARATLAPICGDWRRAAKRYRRFALAQSWLSDPIDARADIPEAVKRGLFVWSENAGAEDADFIGRSASYLKQLLVDGSQNYVDGSAPPEPDVFLTPPFPNGPALALHLYNWHTPIFDTGAPTFDPKPGIATAIASMEADGSTLVIPYINATYADITRPASLGADPDLWESFVKKQPDGGFHTVTSSAGAIYGSVALNTEQWRTTFGALVDRVFALAKGVFLDTYGNANAPDYDADLSSRDPGTRLKGYGPWIAASSRRLGDIAKLRATLGPGRFVTAEHFSEAYIDQIDLVLLYRRIGNLPRNSDIAPADELSEIIGMVPAVYSDYQAIAGFTSSAHDDPRPAAMKHAIGFVLGAHVGVISRGSIGVRGNLDFTLCDSNATAISSYAWVVEQAVHCEPRLAYLTTLARARLKLERYFRGEFLGPAEDRSPGQLITEYWCRSANCAPPEKPLSDLCTDGDRPDDASCASRFRKVVLPAVRGSAWISPDGARAIVLTNTDEIERVVDIPLPRSWAAAYESAQLCRADVLDSGSGDECRTVAIAGGAAAAVALPPFSAYFLQFGSSATGP